MEQVLVGRQPIYRDEVDFFAYELLLRRSQVNAAVFTDGDSATAEVFVNTFMNIRLEQVVGPNLAFVNITRNILLSDFCSLLPSDRVVLEILEDIGPDPDVLNAISLLVGKGYTIALDDFVYRIP